MARQAADAEKKLLILVNSPGAQHFDDFLAIAQEIARVAPDILIHIVTPEDDADTVAAHKWQLPVLTVGFSPLGRFRPKRGVIFRNGSIPKAEQAEILARAGVRIPKTLPYRQGLVLDAAEWGRLVVVKPDDLALTSKGTSASLVPVAKLNEPSLLPEEMRRRLAEVPMLVQEYVPTGEHATSYRVGTLFARVIHMMRKSAPVKVLHPDDPGIEAAVIDSNFETPETSAMAGRELVIDRGIIDFGVRVARAFPDLPLLGIDILKHADTGALYALEINGGGNTWQFSSRHAAPGRRVIPREARIAQFDAWKTCARVLIEKTRYYAR